MKLATNCSQMCLSCSGYINNAECTVVDCVLGETCVCETGYKMEAGKCIKEDECGCYDSEGNQKIPGVPYPNPDGTPCTECRCNQHNQFVCAPKPGCCNYDEWTPWGPCSPECGSDSTKTRFRNSTSPGTCDGPILDTDTRNCSVPKCPCVFGQQLLSDGETVERECSIFICIDGNVTESPKPPVDGYYKQWSDWTTESCVKMCRDYSKSRLRVCESPKCLGAECLEGPQEVDNVECTDAPCCEPEWSEWSNCSVNCYHPGEPRGDRTRTFQWKNPNDTSECEDPVEGTTKPCGDACECDQYQWSAWSTCEEQCGLTQSTRSRNTQSNPSCFDMPTHDSRDCYDHPCNCTAENEEYGNYTYCEKTCADRVEEPNCKEPPMPGCMCVNNTLRRPDGKCVNAEECNKCIYRGVIYDEGEIIVDDQDNCTKYRCDGSALETIDECVHECDLAIEDLVLAPPGSCCEHVCKKKSCEPHSKKVAITVDECIDSYLVDQYSCMGDCGLSSVTFDVTNGNAMVKECKCCVPIQTTSIQYSVQCVGAAANTNRTVSVTKILSCSCNMCPS